MATFSFGKKDVVNAPEVSSIIADAVKRVDKVAQILLLSGFEFEINGKDHTLTGAEIDAFQNDTIDLMEKNGYSLR